MKLIPVLAIVSLTVLLATCGKDKFETKPRIEIKDYSSESIAPGEQLLVRVTYYDKEGDLSKGLFTYKRYRTNGTPIPNPNDNDKADSISVLIPEFPKKNTGELVLTLEYDFMDEDPGRNDSMYFKLAVRDTEGNGSDTITTKVLVARHP